MRAFDSGIFMLTVSDVVEVLENGLDAGDVCEVACPILLKAAGLGALDGLCGLACN